MASAWAGVSADASEFFRLLWGTVVYRPYVYSFFACFLFFAIRHLRVLGTATYLIVAYAVAYASEYSSTRNGFPFGMYVYIDHTRIRELWLSNVPFWDSLSFVFLSYFSWRTAACCLSPRAPERVLLSSHTALLGGFLMMLLDVIIDPLTVLGDRWFLGKIYYYPTGGTYFGVTLANFAGWWFVGAITVWIIQRLALWPWGPMSARHWPNPRRWAGRVDSWGIWGVYAGVMAFNLFMTAWIGEWPLLAASFVVASLALGWSFARFASAERVLDGPDVTGARA